MVWKFDCKGNVVCFKSCAFHFLTYCRNRCYKKSNFGIFILYIAVLETRTWLWILLTFVEIARGRVLYLLTNSCCQTLMNSWRIWKWVIKRVKLLLYHQLVGWMIQLSWDNHACTQVTRYGEEWIIFSNLFARCLHFLCWRKRRFLPRVRQWRG